MGESKLECRFNFEINSGITLGLSVGWILSLSEGSIKVEL